MDNLSLTPDENGVFSMKVAIDDFGHLKNLVQFVMNGNYKGFSFNMGFKKAD